MTAAIRSATSAADVAAIRSLFQEYAASLQIDLAFQNFSAELASLPGGYAAPTGVLFLAEDSERVAVGCVGVRPLAASEHCEMKRLYVAPSTRGMGLGGALAQAAIGFAHATGYADIFLDTLPTMASAQALYCSLGFERIPAYYNNPIPHTQYFRKHLLPQITAKEPE